MKIHILVPAKYLKGITYRLQKAQIKHKPLQTFNHRSLNKRKKLMELSLKFFNNQGPADCCAGEQGAL